MKRLIFVLCAVAPLVPIVHAPHAQAKAAQGARASAPRSVMDYFVLLPSKYARGNARALLDRADPVDEPNDFLQTKSAGGKYTVTVALFRHAGRVLVAVRASSKASEAFDLLRLENGRWKNVTRALVPRYNSSNTYEIPRYGSVIRVYKGHDEDAKYLHALEWRRGKFSISTSEEHRPDEH